MGFLTKSGRTRGAAELDSLFREAVAHMDAGDVAALEAMLAAHPRLLSERLASPGAWLRDKAGNSVNGFFKKPYLLWFVAEDPVRNGKLPPNVADVTRAIIEAAKRARVRSLQKQLDYALRLVAWSWIARECNVQIGLIDALVDAGASPHGNPENALVNGNFAAAGHLVARGAKLTLATALCLERWDDVARLARTASRSDKRFSFVLAALNGKAQALAKMLQLGADVNARSRNLYSHGTPLHHAVCSGSLEAVKVLVEAGANLHQRDSAWTGTPLGWAEHYIEEKKVPEEKQRYSAIAAYLRSKGANDD
jgi:peptide-methionine (S)-S-oxide reductase